MRLVKYTNNATSLLAGNLTAIGLTCTITPGDGAKFPTLGVNEYFMSTLVKADGTKEIVKVTARATDTFTIVRAAEAVAGTQTSYAFSAGDKIELRLTAGMLGDELDRLHLSSDAHVLNKSANYTVVEADVNSLIRVDSTAGTRTITLPTISTLVNEFVVTVSKVSSDGNAVNLSRSGSDTINGATTLSLTSQWQASVLVADKATNTWTSVNSGSGGSGNWIVDAFTGSGTAGPFTLSGNPGTKNNTNIFVGGVYQRKSTYSLASNQITLGGTVATGVPIEIEWAQAVSIGTPADGSVTTAKIDSASADGIRSAIGVTAKNRLINGDMRIDQLLENTSSALGTTALMCADNWWFLKQTAGATAAIQNLNSGPPTGFERYVRYNNTVAAAPAAGDANLFYGSAEGFNVQDLQWGTANAKTVTLSFWIYSGTAGTYGISVANAAANRCYVTAITVNSANTWEYKTVTVTGDTSGTWAKDNTIGITVRLDLGSGSSFETATIGSWQAGNYLRASGNVKACNLVNAVATTGWQLEVSTVATGFEYRDYASELVRCQRYYQKSFSRGVVPAQNSGVTAGSCTYIVKLAGASYDGILVTFPVSMRATPTIVTYNPSAANAKWRNVSLGADSGNASAATSLSEREVLLINNPQVAGDALPNTISIHWTADARI